MRKMNFDAMINFEGGVTGRTCMLLGWATIGFAFSGQFGWAFGTGTAAIASGCFDTKLVSNPLNLELRY